MKNLLGAIILLISFAVNGQNEKNFIDQNYIMVTGKAEMEITPDEIYLKIVLNEKDIKNQTLQETENDMMSKFQEIGIDIKKDLAIADFASNFKNYWIITSDVVLTKEYRLLLHDAKTVGNVFVELQKLGISNISIDKVDNSKLTEYKKAVKIDAIKAAQEKARSLAMAINQDIGRAIYIEEVDYNIINTLSGKVGGIQVRGVSSNVISAGQNKPEPEIEFEKILLESTILVHFELK
jgi:uncharacterized protein